MTRWLPILVCAALAGCRGAGAHPNAGALDIWIWLGAIAVYVTGFFLMEWIDRR